MTCPRCDGLNIKCMTKSPVGDEWEVYVCKDCCYSWRSTEQIKILPKFKVKKESLESLGIIPPIPPLKESQDKE